jgi:hypothetical protein
MPESSSRMPYVPQGVKGLDDDDYDVVGNDKADERIFKKIYKFSPFDLCSQ